MSQRTAKRREPAKSVRIVYLIACRATGKPVEAHVNRRAARDALSIWNHTPKPGYRVVRSEVVETTRSGGGA